jgi:hypothetical protein
MITSRPDGDVDDLSAYSCRGLSADCTSARGVARLRRDLGLASLTGLIRNLSLL